MWIFLAVLLVGAVWAQGAGMKEGSGSKLRESGRAQQG